MTSEEQKLDAQAIHAKNPLDVCVCGDYRRDHINGDGYCTHNEWPKDELVETTDLCHGNKNCLSFTLSEKYNE